MRRFIAAFLITATAAFVVSSSQGASASDPAAEAGFVSSINALRASGGIGGLQSHSVLTAKAQAWAAHMAATNCLCHSNLTDGISVGWRKLGENVGRGPGVASIHNAFYNSPPHRANMLDSQFRYIGVGVAYGFGQMWVAEVLMDGDAPPAPVGNPIGHFDMAVRLAGGVGVSGWALDPNTASSVAVHIYVDGRWATQATANATRGDVASAFPGYGSAHGFNTFVPVSSGPHSVCIYVINKGAGTANPQLGCTYVQNSPFGNLERALPTPTGTRVSGWAIGPDSRGAVGVHLYFNGGWIRALNAGNGRSDVGAAFPGYGSGHGFSIVVPNQTGVLCAYGIANSGGKNSLIGCQYVNTNPFGNLDWAGRQSNAVHVRGWALERDVNGPVPVHIYVDGHFKEALSASVSRPGVAAAFTSTSAGDGFDTLVPIPPGPHIVCAYGINRASGTTNPLLGCART